jgi:hypothetical protein
MSSSPAITMLVAATLGLGVGPALVQLGARGQAWRAALRGLSMTLVGGLCLIFLVPDAFHHGGWLALAAGVVAALSPFAAHQGPRLHGWIWMVTGLGLLSAHAALDGAALALVEGVVGRSLGLAVVAHQLPVGLAVFGAAQRSGGQGGWSGSAVGWFGIGVLMVATVLGFVAGEALTVRSSDQIVGVLEGLVAGALLHVVADAGHDHDADHAHDADHHAHLADEARWWTQAGAAVGLLGVLGFALLGHA